MAGTVDISLWVNDDGMSTCGGGSVHEWWRRPSIDYHHNLG
jgi:hypothetical protein